MIREGKTIPVWFLSAIAIVVVLVVGGIWALVGQDQVEEFERPEYPDGAIVSLEGEGTLVVPVGQKRMPAGWFPPGRYAYEVTFPDGSTWASEPGALQVGRSGKLVVRCAGSPRVCTVAAS